MMYNCRIPIVIPVIFLFTMTGFFFPSSPVFAASLPQTFGYFQQEVHYWIDAELNDLHHTLSCVQKIRYINHSPDTLRILYFHLYANAFRKNSAMQRYQDQRYRAYGGSWIRYLPPRLLGEIQILSLNDHQGNSLTFESDDTILRTIPAKPIAPGDTLILVMEFRLTIPLLIRRMGRNNREGIDYSIAQWYPKVCVYDTDGWHTTPYLGREFYGEIGTYDVSITLPESYCVGATGKLLNAPDHETMMQLSGNLTRRWRLADSIRLSTGSYSPELDSLLSGLLQMYSIMDDLDGMKTWRFRQERAHDFAWCADKDYIVSDTTCGSTRVHLLYLADVAHHWKPMKSWIAQILHYMEKHVGPYPYEELTVAQAGDGGMEYPSIIFITGRRQGFNLASVTAHEIIHQWFYGALANNEWTEAWLDEGITSYYTTRVMESLFGNNNIRERRSEWPFSYEFVDDARHRTMQDYIWWSLQGYEEPVLTPADYFKTDESYFYSVYTKGHIFMNTLEYHFGREYFDELMRGYYRQFAFQHVSTKVFRRYLEKTTGTQLDRLFYVWLNTTARCDYGIRTIRSVRFIENGTTYTETRIQLYRYGDIPVPLDVDVRLQSGEWIGYRIPSHPTDPDRTGRERRPVWSPHERDYTLLLVFDQPITRIVIDTTGLLPDINRWNNQSGWLPPMEWSFRKIADPPSRYDRYRVEHFPSFWGNQPDGLRMGYRFDAVWSVDEHQLKAAVYTGLRRHRFQYDFAYRSPLYTLGRQMIVNARSTHLEGRWRHACAVQKTWYGSGFREPPVHQLIGAVQYERLTHTGYLPRSADWSKTRETRFSLCYALQPFYHRETLFEGVLETSLPGSGHDYQSATFHLLALLNTQPAWFRIRYRAYGGWIFGEAPPQSQLYLSSASPRDQFEEPFFRARGTVPARFYSQMKTPRWWPDGGGSLAGYYTANIRTRQLLTGELTAFLGNPLLRLTKKKWLIFNHATPYVFFEYGVFGKATQNANKKINGSFVMDSGCGIEYTIALIPRWFGQYRLYAELPFWVSRPYLNHPNEKPFKYRWAMGILKK